MNKRLLVILLALVMLVSVLGLVGLAQNSDTAMEQGCYQHGDINSDGTIDTKDAVYALYHAFPMFEEQYPSDQDCDFNKDSVIDSKDAIHLWFASDPAYADAYQLDGTIHRYFEPVWEWEATHESASVKATFQCGCGETYTVTDKDANGVVIEEGSVVEADCVTAGSMEYVGRLNLNGQIFTAIKAVDIPAGDGHSINLSVGCEEDATCDNCDYTVPAKGHDWVLNVEKSTAATCTEDATEWYDCACGQTKTETIEGTAAHRYAYYGVAPVENSTCQFVKQYKCQADGCESLINGEDENDTFTRHTYTATYTEATCQQDGVKTYACVCGDSYTETVPGAGKHVWDEGVEANGVITYSCVCGETKTAVAVSNGQAVGKDTLGTVGELQLEGNTAIELDTDTLDALEDKDIKISVTETAVDNTALTAEQKAQVGDNKVYDFSMFYDDDDQTPISQFAGKVTVSLPYALAADEDVDSIDVWFIADNGALTRMEGTYSNGFVTFTTEHFSYYTVTRLTAAERCARYGHINTTTTVAASCTAEGYTLTACQRCGATEKSNVVAKLGHDYKDTANCAEPTCITSGLKEQACSRCSSVKRQVLVATGHTIEKQTSKCVAASCTAPGKDVYGCACGYSYEMTISQKGHTYASTGVVAPTCASKGYEKFACSVCGKEDIRNEKAALGHSFAAAEKGWTWAKDYSSATLKLVCANDASHEKLLNAVITSKTDSTPCLGGAITYTATASFNNTVYTNKVDTQVKGPGHVVSNRWSTDADSHYHICVVCQETVDSAAHTLKSVVTTAPTCVDAGVSTQTCTVCDYSVNTPIPATGVHSFTGGTCSVCGLAEVGCKHVPNKKTVIDLANYGACGGKVVIVGCACGEKQEISNTSYACQWSEPVYTVEEINGQEAEVGVSTCKVCGLKRIVRDSSVIDAESCTSYWKENTVLSSGGVEIVNITTSYEMGSHMGSVIVREIDAKTLGICEGTISERTCPCGERSTVYLHTACDMNYDPERGVEYCSVCGVTVSWESGDSYEEGCNFVGVENHILTLNGKQIYTFKYTYIMEHHDYSVESFELLGKTCEDGIIVVNKCSKCGDTYETVSAQHLTVLEEKVDLSAYGFCSKEMTISSCPCPVGYKSYYESGDNYCAWAFYQYTDSRREGECSKCGTKQVWVRTVDGKDADCFATLTDTTTFTDINGKTFQAIRNSQDYVHNYQETYKLLGTSCADGVVVTNTCADCGISNSHTTEYHYTSKVAEFDLADHGGCNTKFYYYSCPCTQDNWYGWEEHSCQFEYINGNAHGYTEKCNSCGIVFTQTSEKVADVSACYYKEKVSYTFSKDGKELYNFTGIMLREDHRNLYELTLNEGASSCVDGYRVTQTCLDCNKTIGEWSSSSNHVTYAIKRETISKGQLCGDLDLVTERCACGENESTSLEWNNGSCEYEHTGWDNNYETYKCIVCGSVRKYRETRKLMEGETCRYWDTVNYVFLRDGKTLTACSTGYAYYYHRYEYTFQLNGDTCADGFTGNGVCKLCGNTNQFNYEAGNQYHETFPIEWLDLSDYGACSGLVSIWSCPCGYESHRSTEETSCRFLYSNHSETDLNGVHHSYNVATCRKCGLVVTTDTYNEDVDACHYRHTQKIIYTLGSKLNKTFLTHDTYEDHDLYTVSVQLNPGSVTCEDGISYTRRCKDCDYENTWHSLGHETYPVESIDLAPYGAVCGATLERRVCACGEVNGYELSAESKCELEEKNIPNFVENCLDNSQYTSEGYVGAWSYAYTYICPVTDPQACGLSIRMSDYWMQEGCEAVRYELWQLGYNSETGTCQKELKLATGERMTFHPYVYTDESAENADGSYTNIYKKTCSICGSTYTDRYDYDANGYHIRSEEIAVNKLNNGENQKRALLWEYERFEDYSRETFYKRETVSAAGEVSWETYEYTYSAEDPCSRTTVETDSEGNSSTTIGEYHYTIYEHTVTKENTCTQHGTYKETQTCRYCGTVDYEYIYQIEPNAHSWSWNEDLQKYVCGSCGLESDNNASGSIVLEDLSETYGNGTSYVIGYWNRGGVKVNTYVSVILDNVAEGQDPELPLEGITFQNLTVENDGVRALSFSKSAAQAAADAAIQAEGYTGSYAIRISFVPLEAEDELDYAITFDSQIAQ